MRIQDIPKGTLIKITEEHGYIGQPAFKKGDLCLILEKPRACTLKKCTCKGNTYDALMYNQTQGYKGNIAFDKKWRDWVEVLSDRV